MAGVGFDHARDQGLGRPHVAAVQGGVGVAQQAGQDDAAAVERDGVVRLQAQHVRIKGEGAVGHLFELAGGLGRARAPELVGDVGAGAFQTLQFELEQGEVGRGRGHRARQLQP